MISNFDQGITIFPYEDLVPLSIDPDTGARRWAGGVQCGGALARSGGRDALGRVILIRRAGISRLRADEIGPRRPVSCRTKPTPPEKTDEGLPTQRLDASR